MTQRTALTIPMIGLLMLGLAVNDAPGQDAEVDIAQAHRRLLTRRYEEINRAIRSNQPNPKGEDVKNDPIHSNLKRVLITELKFIQKVCDPNDTEFAGVVRDGAAWVNDFPSVGRTLSLSEPDLRNLVTTILAESVERHLPKPTSAQYQQELDARMAARHRAVASIITSLVDQDAILSVEQFRSIESSLFKKWKPDWPDAATIALNELNAVLPGWSSAKTYLSPVQRELWGYRGKQKSRDPGRASAYNSLNLFDVDVESFPDLDAELSK